MRRLRHLLLSLLTLCGANAYAINTIGGVYILLCCILPMLVGCREDVDTSSRYVFKEYTVMGYLQAHAESYSEYVGCLDRVLVWEKGSTHVGQLLSARGHFTVFAPTNDAIAEYLKSLVEDGVISRPSWDAFADSTKLDSIRRVIVMNSIINSGDDDNWFETGSFPASNGGEFILANLMDRKLNVRYASADSIYINRDCPINPDNKDIITLNGVIHQMERVIAPKDVTAADYLQDIIVKGSEGYLVMARVLQGCGLLDSLRPMRDEVYERKYKNGEISDLVGMTSAGFREGNTAYAPEHRKFGFTLFAETDDFWHSQGLEPTAPDLLSQLTKWILDNHQYSEDDIFVADGDYTSDSHILRQWATYHILPMRIPPNKLVFHQNEYGFNLNLPFMLTVPVYEIYTTLGRRRLLKIYESKESDGIYLNRFPTLDNGRRGTGHETGCDDDKVGCKVIVDDDRAVLSDIVNACIYPIDAPLSYNDETRNNLFRQRLRIDIVSIFPEAMNNDMRKKASHDERHQHVYIPKRCVYPYFENLWVDDNTNFVYYNAFNEIWPNLNADEVKAVGNYDITLRLPPVPRRGTYEVRYGYIANDRRGVVQIYFGNDRNNLPVTDIPLDLTRSLLDRTTGFEFDTEDDDYNAEIDKRMRNNGFMKGGKSYAQAGNTAHSGRVPDASFSPARRIFLCTTLDPRETYYLRLKSVLDSDKKEFMLDYIEYCPKEVYDNPEVPEDIW